MNKWQSVAPVQTPPQIQQPTYDRLGLHTTDAGVRVPFEQAAFTGTLAALLVAFIVWNVIGYFSFAILKWFIGTWLVVTFGWWMLRQRHWQGLTNLEYFFGDLNNDNIIGPPPETTIRVNKNTEYGSWKQTRYTFSVEPELLLRFFVDTLTGHRSISRRDWTAPKNPVFSQGGFNKFAGQLRAQGWVIGNDYTEEGWTQALEYVRASSPTLAEQIEQNGGRQPTNQPTNQPDADEIAEGEVVEE